MPYYWMTLKEVAEDRGIDMVEAAEIAKREGWMRIKTLEKVVYRVRLRKDRS